MSECFCPEPNAPKDVDMNTPIFICFACHGERSIKDLKVDRKGKKK